MDTQSDKVIAKITKARNLLLSVFFAGMAVSSLIDGLEGRWFSWISAIIFFCLCVSVIRVSATNKKIDSVPANVVLLIIIGIGIFSIGMLLLDDLAAL